MNKIILVGNPNVGKTTLFNTLTKSFEKASNWHGVTVGVKNKKCKIKNHEFEVCDLPGIYSLGGYSKEEKIACEFLSKNKNSLVINILDANNIERNLKLTIELIKKGYNVVIAVNMSNENKTINIEKLSRSLGVLTMNIDARKNDGVAGLKQVIIENISQEKTQNNCKINKICINNDDFIKNIAKNDKNDPYLTSDKIDNFILNKYLFVPIFLLIILFVFYITFGEVGSAFSSIITQLLSQIAGKLRIIISCTNINKIVLDFIFDGVIGSVISVFNFVPQIVLLMLFFNVLEDIGFMSRVAFMLDGFLKKIGLSGKSFFSLMMGFGCTTSAVLTTRNLENQRLRKRTILLLPFMSCSAKLPVFLVVSSLFFEKYKFLFVFGLYLFSIFLSLCFAILYKKFLPSNDSFSIFEMPKYRLPNFKKICIDVWIVVCDFLIKAGTLILFFSSVIWLLQNFSLSFVYLEGENFNQSILYFFANKLKHLFSPLGLGNPGIVCAIIFGVFAKEMVVVGLSMINGVAGESLAVLSCSLLSPSSVCSFSLVSSVIFLIFILLYSPCVSVIATIKNEINSRFALYVFVAQFLIAYCVSFLIFIMIKNSTFAFLILLFFVLDILLLVVLRLNRKINCFGGCNACGKICHSKKSKIITESSE